MPEKIKTMEEVIHEFTRDSEIKKDLAQSLRSSGFIHRSEIVLPEKKKEMYVIRGHKTLKKATSILKAETKGFNTAIDLMAKLNGKQ